MENLNLVELLRDCPTGMELDSTVFDNITFDYVNIQQKRVYCKVGKSESVWFTPKGGVNLLSDAKCVIFPKGKTTWEGFQRPFKDGDILSYQYKDFKNRTIYIYMYHDRMNTTYYVALSGGSYSEFMINYEKGHALNSYNDTVRFATEEEKQKLFGAIKANGYKWNAETKTLEKLIEPKFKVGDRVKHILAYTSGIVVKVSDKGYHIDYPKGEGVCYISFELEKDYELAPNKFDITTLKAFDKVLYRMHHNDTWLAGFYNVCINNKFFVIGSGVVPYYIPYENNEHLLGTTNDCEDFYKTWENNN